MKQNKAANDELVELVTPFDNQAKFSVSTMTQERVTLFLNTDIRTPEYYTVALDKIRNLNEDDLVSVIIDSDGGNVDGLLAIQDALDFTEATVVVTVTGRAYSAASILALSADNLNVSPNARFMLHSASYGNYGKVQEVRNYQLHIEKLTTDIMHRAYTGFLTEDELNKLLGGFDFWMTYDEIVDRLEKRSELFKAIQEDEERESKLQEIQEQLKALEPEPEVQPVEKPRSRSKA